MGAAQGRVDRSEGKSGPAGRVEPLRDAPDALPYENGRPAPVPSRDGASPFPGECESAPTGWWGRFVVPREGKGGPIHTVADPA